MNIGAMIYPTAHKSTEKEQFDKIVSEMSEVSKEMLVGNRIDAIHELFDVATAALTMARNKCESDEEFYMASKWVSEKNAARGYFKEGVK